MTKTTTRPADGCSADTTTITITPASHVDHGLSPAALQWVLAALEPQARAWLRATSGGPPRYPLIASLELPLDCGLLDCGLHGPIMGDAAVPASEVWHAARGSRAWSSRLCDRPMRQTRTVTVVAGPSDGAPCVLFTAYGGPAAPREPGDPSVDVSELDFVMRWWGEHALTGSRSR